MFAIHVSIIHHSCCYITVDYLILYMHACCRQVVFSQLCNITTKRNKIRANLWQMTSFWGWLIPIEKYNMGTVRFLQAITTIQCHERFQQSLPCIWIDVYISRHSSIRSISRTPWWPHYITCRWFQTQIHVSIQDFNCVFSLYDRHDYNRRKHYYWDDERLFDTKKGMGMQCQDVGDVVEEAQIKWWSLKGPFCGLCVYRMMELVRKGPHSDCLP